MKCPWHRGHQADRFSPRFPLIPSPLKTIIGGKGSRNLNFSSSVVGLPQTHKKQNVKRFLTTTMKETKPLPSPNQNRGSAKQKMLTPWLKPRDSLLGGSASGWRGRSGPLCGVLPPWRREQAKSEAILLHVSSRGDDSCGVLRMVRKGSPPLEIATWIVYGVRSNSPFCGGASVPLLKIDYTKSWYQLILTSTGHQ